MCSGSEAGSYLRLRLLHHSTLGLRVIKKRRRGEYGILGDPYTDTSLIRNSLLLGSYST